MESEVNSAILTPEPSSEKSTIIAFFSLEIVNTIFPAPAFIELLIRLSKTIPISNRDKNFNGLVDNVESYTIIEAELEKLETYSLIYFGTSTLVFVFNATISALVINSDNCLILLAKKPISCIFSSCSVSDIFSCSTSLANVLITEPDLLILDEPTNHLDLEMIEWLENYLSRSTMSILMVTHDRYFLDRICSSIIEMDDEQLYFYTGNYSYYLDKRQERIDARNTAIDRANNLYRTELEWMRRMPQARGHKAKYREDAFYELEKVAKQRIDTSKVRLEMGATYIGSKIFEATDVCKAYGDKVILKDFNYVFSRYEKMGIVGNNGTGKSTFIKMLLGEVPYDSGNIDVGETVRFGYYSQEGISFRDDQKVIEAVRDIAEYVDMGNGQRLSASLFLQHFLFEPEAQYNYIGKLSGGEKRRLYLCTVLMQSPNFLVLDEPTNDLDIVTLQILEEYLKTFKGCLIVISHDRYFMDKVVDHLLVFQGEGDIRDFPGNYTQYREWKTIADKEKAEQERIEKEKQERKLQNTAGAPANTSHRGSKNERRLTFKERKEMEQLESDLERLEQEKTEIETALSNGSLSVDEITSMSKRLPLLNDEIDEKTMRWLELSEIGS